MLMNKDNRGVTLVELVVVIAILGAILASIYSFYLVGVKGYTRETTRAINQTSIRRASNEVSRQVRRASDVKVDVESIGLEELNDTSPLQLVFEDGRTIFYNMDGKSLKAYHYTPNPHIETGYSFDYSRVISDRVSGFDVDLTHEANSYKITIIITSMENADGMSDKLESFITLRQ